MNDLKELLNYVHDLKTGLEKEAFSPMPGGQAPAAGAPQPAAPAPQPGAPAPQAAPVPQPGAPAPQAGGSLLEILQQQGIDPNQLLQDPNMLQQVAQAAGLPPEQLAQMVQAEMGGGAAPAPAPEQAQPDMAGPVQELFSAVEQMIPMVQQQQEQILMMQKQIDALMQGLEDPAPLPDGI